MVLVMIYQKKYRVALIVLQNIERSGCNDLDTMATSVDKRCA